VTGPTSNLENLPTVYRAVVETRRPTKVPGVDELVATRCYGPFATASAARERARVTRSAIERSAGYTAAGYVESSTTTWRRA
jgi:hypothetical protein